jgi:ribosomal 50S subunit-associated protein YjgA (DUF615 family)
MEDNSRKGIRRLLKTFGIQADEALVAFLARHPEIDALQIRITLENIGNYENGKPSESLHLVVEDTIERN